EVSAGLSTGQLLLGQLSINKFNADEAFIGHPIGDADVLIGSRIDRNRALNDDRVAVRIKPVASWRALGFSNLQSTGEHNQPNQQQQWVTVQSVISAGQATFADLFPGVHVADQLQLQRLLQSSADPCQPLPVDRVQRVGQVVAIVNQIACRRFVGRVKPRTGEVIALSGLTQKMDIFEPLDPRQPGCNVPRSELTAFGCSAEQLRRQIFVAELDHWAPVFFMPKARICQRLGERADGRIDIELETRVILEQLGIADSIESVPEELTAADGGVSEQEAARRRDFRDPLHYCIFTVDKAMAQDLDDAVHYRALDGGDCEVGVHIADVSHYVRPGSQVDKIARDRAVSTYLEQRTCHMLPHYLSEHLCSMKPAEDKLAFSIVWRIEPCTGAVRSTWMGKSVVRSCCQLSYPQAQSFIEGHSNLLKSETDVNAAIEMPEAPHTVQAVADSVRAMHQLSKKLLERRVADGALIIDPPKMKFRFGDACNAPPVDFSMEESSDSRSMIEELMVLANCSVARKLRDSSPQLAFLRQQLPPSGRALQNLCRNLAVLGVQLDTASSSSLQASIEQAAKSLDPEMQLYLQKICVAPMPRALNFCIGADAQCPNRWRHYSLNVPVYATFTSPIRRYADIVVHRQLSAAIWAEAGREPEESAKLQDAEPSLTALARHCNKKEKDASEASRRSTELHFAAYLRSQGPLNVVGRVVGVLDKAFDVFLFRSGQVGRIYLDQQDIVEFKLESDHVFPQLMLYFQGCGSEFHRLTLVPKSRVDVLLAGCQLLDGRSLKLALQLKPPACELCGRS
uniref:RNB domain-containing protein n=1 Tax=Macrostomum lignano TaxID=282301 RepID=A0A1I8FWB3_9PLAT